ncbi:hypothetical protein HJC23_010730 [Cyclotella cryptica]|uniref:Kinesin motor domain-containing protein n=1 Tax=Cyclotella cryptica TaxID=29204 RepID=A0ABD3PUY7_9STRA|eukprot:CCRYP_011073-RA/>CCRYP_011073-RA protein AED:0.18 eAED:0.18 QI:293/1/1/1/1/1/6/250/1214
MTPTPSQCVESWLTASGLSYAIPNFRMAGIVSPRSFVELELSYYEPLGIKRPEDRKRLFFLIQKVRSELEKEGENGREEEDSDGGYDVVTPMSVKTTTGRGDGRLAGHNTGTSNHRPSNSAGSSSSNVSEVGMFVDTSSSNMDPTSPVTLASPLARDNEYNNNKNKYSSKSKSAVMEQRKETTNSSMRVERINESNSERLTSRERLAKELAKRRALKMQEEQIGQTKSGFESTNSHVSDGNTNTYTDDFDDVDNQSSTKGRSHKSNRRSSMLPRIKREITTPKTISTGRPSLHSRLTVKKGNQSVSGGTSNRAYLPSRDYDEESVDSETSDLSSSIQSFTSRGSSAIARTKNSKTSTVTKSFRTDENRQRNGVEATLTSRVGNKRLSTIPASTVAPVSPLAPSNLDNSKMNHDIEKSSMVYRTKNGGRPGTAGSASSMKSTSTNISFTSTSSGRSHSKTNVNSRPSSRSSIGSTSSRKTKSSATSVLNAKAPLKSPSRPNGAPPKSPNASFRGPTQRDRSISPTKSTSAGSAAPHNITKGRTMSPARSIKTAGVQGRPLSPTRSVKTTTPRDRSVTPTRSIKTATPHYSPTPPMGRSRSPLANNSAAVFIHGQAEDKSWGTQIAQLRENFQLEHDQLMHGREAYHEDDDYEMRIRVIVRKRPMSKNEAAEIGDVDVIHPLDYVDYGRILVYQPKTKLDLAKEVETTSFAFDNVFNEDSNNIEIYKRSVQNLIPGVFQGKWASVFAYGQTGSGKTFTMMGSNMTGLKAGNQSDNLCEANLGLYFLAARDVFRIAEQPEYENISISVSLFEIYGGKLIDLLNRRNQVKCLEDSKGKVCFPGLSEHPVYDADELMDIIEKGSLNRSTGTTSANADSSRSHAVLQLSLRKDVGRMKGKEHGRLTFIDLAGSERGADTNQASKTTRMEGAEINTSLLALKEVIRALATGSSMKRIPFRGSKLTQVLKDSFVGKNTRTVMVSCVAPNMKNCDHTLNTLRYADRVKERNSQTGELSAAVAANSLIKRDQSESAKIKLPQRPLTAPAASFRIEHVDDSSDDEVPPPPSDKCSDKFCYSNGFDEGKTLDSDSIEAESFEGSLTSENDLPSTDTLTPKNPASNNETEAARFLISTHKSIMARMLAMVKHEMALVQDTDVDRNFDDYLMQIGTLADNHLSLLSTMRESLDKFKSSKTLHANVQTSTLPSLLCDSYDCDESFDLRD